MPALNTDPSQFIIGSWSLSLSRSVGPDSRWVVRWLRAGWNFIIGHNTLRRRGRTIGVRRTKTNDVQPHLHLRDGFLPPAGKVRPSIPLPYLFCFLSVIRNINEGEEGAGQFSMRQWMFGLAVGCSLIHSTVQTSKHSFSPAQKMPVFLRVSVALRSLHPKFHILCMD